MVFGDEHLDLASTTCSGKLSFAKSVSEMNFRFEAISKFDWQEQRQMKLVRRVRTGRQREARLAARIKAREKRQEHELMMQMVETASQKISEYDDEIKAGVNYVDTVSEHEPNRNPR